MGISLDPDGEPVAVFEPCENRVAGVAVIEVDHDGRAMNRLSRVEMDGSEDVREYAFLNADVQIEAGQRYELAAWAEGTAAWPFSSGANLASVWFEASDIAKLEPGKVMYRDPDRFTASRIGDPEEFVADACP
ncbi:MULTISPECIES: hypothetical protein [unclassified Agromyces]|uniref:hypothetical protein n=1 Tax=unclassified Agromyces TaxID=2639701 RepID=UPI003015411E